MLVKEKECLQEKHLDSQEEAREAMERAEDLQGIYKKVDRRNLPEASKLGPIPASFHCSAYCKCRSGMYSPFQFCAYKILFHGLAREDYQPWFA